LTGGPKQPARPAAQGTPSPAVPPDRPEPATAEDLRGVRRWLLVAGVWAVAATAIAVIALVTANRDDDEEQNARTAGQITRVQNQLTERLDELEDRLGELAPAEDVTKLDNRLKKVEDGASRTSDRLDALGDDLDDLQSRVEELEQQAEAGTDTTDTTTTP
jgi:septal ring factor EnvC (AmiA/AmiB activator)